jgi:hypothetical protein
LELFAGVTYDEARVEVRNERREGGVGVRNVCEVVLPGGDGGITWWALSVDSNSSHFGGGEEVVVVRWFLGYVIAIGLVVETCRMDDGETHA